MSENKERPQSLLGNLASKKSTTGTLPDDEKTVKQDRKGEQLKKSATEKKKED